MRRLLILVSSIVFVETIFFSALSPLLPHYSEEFGLSKTGSGVLLAAYALGGLFGAIPGGLFATRIGVKPTVLFGLGVMSAMSVVFGFADSVWLLDVARLGQGFGSAFAWGGGLAWLVAAAPRERRGELIGIAMGAAVGGALLGPVLGSVATLVGTGPAFTAVAVVGAGLGVWAWVTPAFRPGARQPLSDLFRAVREPRVAGGIWLLALPSLLFGVLGLLAPLRLEELGFSGTAIGGVFLVAAGFEALGSPLIGRWSDRRGRLAPVRAFLVLAIAMSLLLPWPAERWTLAALVVSASIAYAAFFVPGTALLADGAEDAGLDQGFGFALLNLAWAPGHIVGSAAGGALADATGDAIPYLILAGLCLTTLFALRHAPAALARRAPRSGRSVADVSR
jgi:predicted MFS family arabinose efflux permease